MLARLSSKGQVVIPCSIRHALGLRAGTQISIRLAERSIVLEPMTGSPIADLYGKYRRTDLLAELESEHQREMIDEPSLRA